MLRIIVLGPVILVVAIGAGLYGCSSSPVGQGCVSRGGLPGKIVATETDCYYDDAFCERRSDGHYCTGGQPLVCPAGQEEISFGTCGVRGGAGGGGSLGCGGATACGGPACRAVLNSAGLDTGFESCDDGTFRRRAALVCPLPPMRPADAGVASGECTADSDCGIGGVCAEAHNLDGYTGCWPGCRQDADCGAGQICQCGEPAGRCVPAQCTTNADCGAGFGCVATGDGSAGACTVSLNYPNPASIHYVCQRSSDECSSTDDCTGRPGQPTGEPDGGAASRACLYDGRHRVCGYICAGPV